ncbi:MAG: cysteine hydrolase family protein [Bacteroidota bacterium]
MMEKAENPATSTTALLIIDLQNDFFSGGKFPLEGSELVAPQAARLLRAFRDQEMPVVYLRQEDTRENAPYLAPETEGAQLSPWITNQKNEVVITHTFPNGFSETGLKSVLDSLAATDLIICGAMSHLQVSSTTRAASDLGYTCTVVYDACATRSLTAYGVTTPAIHVHVATMTALGSGYARIALTDELLAELPAETPLIPAAAT